MDLILQRTKLDPISTTGEMFVDGTFQCYTLELPVKDGLPGSAIPPGKYLVQLGPSPKFEASADPWVKELAPDIPHVLGIPNRSNILIHWGNDATDTEGCILVGSSQGEDFVGGSRVAFSALWRKLMVARSNGETISIQVQGGLPEGAGWPGQ